MFQNRNHGFAYKACSARHLHIGNLWMNLFPSIQFVGKAGRFSHGNKELQELEERGAKHVAQVTETVSWLSGH